MKRPNEVKNENFIGFGDSSFCEMHIEFKTFREQSKDSKGNVPVSRLDGYLFLLSIDFCKRQNESFGDNNGEDKLGNAFRYILKTGLGARAYKNYSPTLRGLITTTGPILNFFFGHDCLFFSTTTVTLKLYNVMHISKYCNVPSKGIVPTRTSLPYHPHHI